MRAKLFGEVHLHLGAHRTGSTTFQMILGENSAAILAQGVRVGFAGRGDIPNGNLDLRVRHQAFAKGKARVKQHIAEIRSELAPFVKAEGSKHAIISDENMLGGMAPFELGAFYPDVPLRMEIIRKALFPNAIGNLLLMVRPYDTLFESAFRKRAERFALPAFPEVAPVQTRFEGGWPKVVDQILNTLKPKRLFVVTYGRDRDDLALLKQLCPTLDVTGMKRPETWVNSSFTDNALFECQRQIHAGEELTQEASWAIRDAFAEGQAEQPFAKFAPKQAAMLKDRYQADLATLRNHAGITFLEF